MSAQRKSVSGVDDAEYRRRTFAVEAYCNDLTLPLRGSVPLSPYPGRAGESAMMSHVAHVMALEQRNAKEIARIEALKSFLCECIDADAYGMERPTDARFTDILAMFDREWSAP